jgi:hypothetical protein
MPLATIHLLAFPPSTNIASAIQNVKDSISSSKILVISKVVRWIITPEHIDAEHLLRPKSPWTLLVIVLGTDSLPTALKNQLDDHWTCQAGVPSRLTNSFGQTNQKLLHPREATPLSGALEKPRIGSSSQTLELSTELQSWISTFKSTKTGSSPLSMLNLLAFKPNMKPSYLKYGAAFAESIGSKRGGNAKLVGNVTAQSETSGGKWDEFALASYPSILHFADMLASEDYQAVNQKYRVPALADTLILCTSEIAAEDAMGTEVKAKL